METAEQREEIFNAVCLMRSFHVHGSHPKLQNWFAWNKCSYEGDPEFFGTKLIFEATLQSPQRDPEQEPFEVAPPLNHATARAQLQQLLKSTGGAPLAYSLMKDGLHQYTRVLANCEQALRATLIH